MKHLTYFLIASSLVFLIACTDSGTKNEASNCYDIELNNGEKWKVVDEMMAHIRAMEQDVNEFKIQQKSSYPELGKMLLVNVDLLTSNCTMTGKAHDELHKWLLPYIDLVDALVKSVNDQKSKEIFGEIKTSFEEFNRFFE